MRSIYPSNRRATATIAAIGLFVASGCGGSDVERDVAGPTAPVATADSAASGGASEFFAAVRSRRAPIARITAYGDVLDAGPNVTYVDDADQMAFDGGVVSDVLVLADPRRSFSPRRSHSMSSGMTSRSSDAFDPPTTCWTGRANRHGLPPRKETLLRQ